MLRRTMLAVASHAVAITAMFAIGAAPIAAHRLRMVNDVVTLKDLRI